MDRTEKFLRKLSAKELLLIEEIIENLYKEKVKDLDIKKLKGHNDVFRVRYNSIRIIFRKINKEIMILEISRRSEKTYRSF